MLGSQLAAIRRRPAARAADGVRIALFDGGKHTCDVGHDGQFTAQEVTLHLSAIVSPYLCLSCWNLAARDHPLGLFPSFKTAAGYSSGIIEVHYATSV